MSTNNISSEDNKTYAQVSQESITTWAETVGIADLSPEIGKLLASDVTYRLRQALHNCRQHLHASKRRRLTPDDFNRALKWMDVPPVMGHSGCLESPEYTNIPEVGVHILQDNPLSLVSTAVRGDIYHQPGNPCVKGEWLHLTNHVSVKESGGDGCLSALPLSIPLTNYYQTLMSSILGNSKANFKHMETDLQSNPNLGPLVGAIVCGCQRGAQLARQNPSILRRVLVVARALLANQHLHVGHTKYVQDIMNLIVFCAVTDRKQSSETHLIRSMATNTLIKVISEWSEGRSAYDLAVTSLSGVIASTSRPWSQHTGALSALQALGPSAQVSLIGNYRSYNTRLEKILNSFPSAPIIASKDALDVKITQGTLMVMLVKSASSYVKNLPDNIELNIHPKSTKKDGGVKFSKSKFERVKQEFNDVGSSSQCKSNTSSSLSSTDVECFNRLREIYSMGEEWFGSAFVLQVPTLYLSYHKNLMPDFMESHLYQEMQTTGEKLLEEMLNKEETGAKDLKMKGGSLFDALRPPSKRPRLGKEQEPSYDLEADVDFSSMDFESLINDTTPMNSFKNSVETVFSSPEDNQFYKSLPRTQFSLVNFQLLNCAAWESERLKKPKGLFPKVKHHPNRHLLTNHYKSKSFIGRMPHCKFTRPLQPKIRPGYSMHNIVL